MTSKSSSVSSSNNAQVFGQKSSISNAKKLTSEKVSDDFFDDFNLDEDEDAPEEPEPQPETKSTSLGGFTSTPSTFGTFQDIGSGNKTTAKSSFSKPSEPKKTQQDHINSVTSDDFVPQRNKSAWQQKKQETGFGYAQQNFSNAKSISSTQFFAESEPKKTNPETEARLSQFSSAKSISSAQFYGRDEGNREDDDDDDDDEDVLNILGNALGDVDEIKDYMGQGFNKLKEFTSSWFDSYE